MPFMMFCYTHVCTQNGIQPPGKIACVHFLWCRMPSLPKPPNSIKDWLAECIMPSPFVAVKREKQRHSGTPVLEVAHAHMGMKRSQHYTTYAASFPSIPRRLPAKVSPIFPFSLARSSFACTMFWHVDARFRYGGDTVWGSLEMARKWVGARGAATPSVP